MEQVIKQRAEFSGLFWLLSVPSHCRVTPQSVSTVSGLCIALRHAFISVPGMAESAMEQQGANLQQINAFLLKCKRLQPEMTTSPCGWPSSLQDSISLGKLDFISDLDFFFFLRINVCHVKHFFDMAIPGIIRYIKNNEELSISKQILSSYYLPSVPSKCHLWSVPLFVEKHKTFFTVFSKAVDSVLNLCVELQQVAPKLKCSKPLF